MHYFTKYLYVIAMGKSEALSIPLSHNVILRCTEGLGREPGWSTPAPSCRASSGPAWHV